MYVLFIEPPKDFWFILGKYIPPPFGILTLAAYLEREVDNVEIEVVDCQAEKLDWEKLEKRIEASSPDLVAPSGLATCNAPTVIRTTSIAKNVDPRITTVVGGQHFTSLANEVLETCPSVDVVVRGEGEQTLSELTEISKSKKSLSGVKGISFRHENKIIHNADRQMLCDLDSLPFPGYQFVKDHMKKYHFALMAGKDTPFAIIEGSRGCRYSCFYCSQWSFWQRQHRAKTPERIADEFESIHKTYGSKFFWLTDDNFGLGRRMEKLCDEILERGFAEDISWFVQARCDDIVRNGDLLAKMRMAGNIWILLGLDTPDPTTLREFRRNGVDRTTAKRAVDLLRKHNILSQGTFIIGARKDSQESIRALVDYADWLDPDIATFMALTPFPGTEVYETAMHNGWLEDRNWANYDMIHAIMPTEHLTREEVQKELYECYRAYFGSWKRRYQGLFSENRITRRTYQYLAREAILIGLRSLF